MKNKAAIEIFELIKSEEQNFTTAITDLFTKKESNKVHIHSYFENIVSVRTIWKMETKVAIDDFYCQPKVVSLSDNTPFNFKLASEFPVRSALITGPAGQGKSIYLRKLCYDEYINGDFLPIFISLRTIRNITVPKGIPFQLYFLILEQIQTMGLVTRFDVNDIKESTSIIEKILDSGKVILLLDGFDELTEDYQEVCASEINSLHQKYLDLKIFVTSRPEAEKVYKTPFLANFRIAPLERNSAKIMIKKYSESDEQSELLNKAIEEHDYALQLFTTPLLITIMVIVYKSIQKIPVTLSEFYEYAIMVLLSRHDGTKPGFTRVRKSTLNDPNFCKVFNAFCYVTARDNKLELSELELIDYSKEALKKTIFDAKLAQGYASDVNEITNLLIKDGISYVFVHKTIQEYFSAKYVAILTDDNIKKFYDIISSSDALMAKWRQQLTFLKYIDKYRFVKYFQLINAKNISLLSIDFSTGEVDLSDDFLNNLLIRYKATGKLNPLKPESANSSISITCHDVSFSDPAELWIEFKSKLNSILGPKLQKLIQAVIIDGSISQEHAKSGFHNFDIDLLSKSDQDALCKSIKESNAFIDLITRVKNILDYVKRFDEEQADSTKLGGL